MLYVFFILLFLDVYLLRSMGDLECNEMLSYSIVFALSILFTVFAGIVAFSS